MKHKIYSIEEFLNTENLVCLSFSNKEDKIIYSSDETGIFNIYSINLETGKRVRLTDSTKDSIYSLGYLNDKEDFLYLSDKGGNELTHIYLQKNNGKVKDLTPGDKHLSKLHSWAKDKKSFFFNSNKRDLKKMDIYEMDSETLTENLFYENEESLNPGIISKNKKYILLTKTITNSTNELYIYNRDKNELKQLFGENKNVKLQPVYFNNSSTKFYYLTDLGHEFTYLNSYDIETGNVKTIAKEDWHIINFSVSKNEKYYYYILNFDGRNKLVLRNTEDDSEVNSSSIPEGQVLRFVFSESETYGGFYLTTSTSSKNLYLFNFKTFECRKLTDTMSPQIDEKHLVKSEIVRYPSFDKLEIPAVFYKPHTASKENKVPALVWVHGGPGGQSKPSYNPLLQYLANNGICIIAVNNRGSSGYGKTFFDLDIRKHGDHDLKDCIHAKDFLKSKDYIDGEHIGIIGGSYGGYMVLAALAFAPEEFRLGVNIFGVSNWIRTLSNTPPWWEAMKKALFAKIGDPEIDRDYLESISPLFHSDKITKPLMVLQGANDPRVLKIESDEIVEQVKANNVPVEYVVFDDEGHGFKKKKNQITGNRKILEFLKNYL